MDKISNISKNIKDGVLSRMLQANIDMSQFLTKNGYPKVSGSFRIDPQSWKLHFQPIKKFTFWSKTKSRNNFSTNRKRKIVAFSMIYHMSKGQRRIRMRILIGKSLASDFVP